MAGAWTNNWRAFRNIMLMGCVKNGFSTIVLQDGTTMADDTGNNLSATSPLGIYNNDPGTATAINAIRLGTGNTAPTAADYALEANAAVSYLSVLSGTPTFDAATGTMTRTITLSVQNQSAENITIQEWGIFGSVRTLSYGSNLRGIALLYREVLDTPVLLSPTQAATLTLTMTMTLTDIL